MPITLKCGLAARRASSHVFTFSTPPISVSCSSTSSLAPPCNGPDRVPMAAEIVAYGLARLDPVTRAVNVLALNPCSAWRIRQASITLRTDGDGSRPNSM
jgi:hypothetical protein